ncbi:MAG: hypothetical protein NTV22_09105, partial [bacterium]|nr:hypothetical protein [bacterium]
SLHIRAPGYAVCYDRLALTPGATSQMTMALLPVPTRFVRVYDADTQREIPTVTFSAPQPVSTNHDGIACMPLPNSCSVRVSAPGYAPASRYLNSDEPLLTNIIWLASPFDLTVYVYNADGTPATAGTVDVYCATPNADYRDNARRFSGTTSIGAGGTASFHNVPCYFSNATVCVRNVNWVPLASLSVENIRAQTHRDVAITNPPLCRFAVTVHTDAANPMRTLECVGNNYEGDGLRQYELRQIMQSKTNSVWHADLFPTGTYAFAMLFDNDVRLRTNVTVTSATRSIQLFPRPGDLVSLRIILRPATTNVALQAVTVVVMNSREYFVARYRTGEFVCVGLEPGACYYVNVDLVTTALVLSNVTPRSGPLYVNLPPLYTLRGTVVCPDRAPARTRVVCSRKPFEYPAGRFAVPAIPPGTFPVTIGVAGHSATTFPVTITDQDVDLGTIRLTATGAAVVTGRILGGNADTHRRIYWYNGLDYRDNSFTVADDGRFRTLPITRGSLVALSLISASGRTKIADVLLTNAVIDIGDVCGE